MQYRSIDLAEALVNMLVNVRGPRVKNSISVLRSFSSIELEKETFSIPGIVTIGC